jgi:hypothetical protein
MYYFAFFVPYCLQVDSTTLKVRDADGEPTSRPERSHSASEWIARQYTADILGGCIECLTGVENSSRMSISSLTLYLDVLHFPSMTKVLQPIIRRLLKVTTLVTLSTNGCFCATVNGTLPFMPAKWSNLRI